jgi:hypothetical protein
MEVRPRSYARARPYKRKDELVQRTSCPQATYAKINDQIFSPLRGSSRALRPADDLPARKQCASRVVDRGLAALSGMSPRRRAESSHSRSWLPGVASATYTRHPASLDYGRLVQPMSRPPFYDCDSYKLFHAV